MNKQSNVVECNTVKGTKVKCNVVGLNKQLPDEIFMIKVVDPALLTKMDLEYLGEYGEDKDGYPYVEAGRGFFKQAAWNSKRFLTKKAAESWLEKEMSPLLWDSIRKDLRNNLVIVKTKTVWEKA